MDRTFENADGYCEDQLVAEEEGTGTPEGERKILMIFHRAEGNPGAVGQWLLANGFKMERCCPAIGDRLPQTLDAYSGAVMFGGPMSANDPDEYIKKEIDWLAVPLAEEKPFFGICLGAQMLAKQLGGQVGEHPEAHVEVGYYPIRPLNEANRKDNSAIHWPSHVYQWHREGFTMPYGAKRLVAGVEGAAFENQAMQYGKKAFGVQFHPEMTLAMIHRWTTHTTHRLTGPNARPRIDHIEDHNTHGPHLRRWLDRFMRQLFSAS